MQAGELAGAHQLLEALSLHTADQVFRGGLVAIEEQRIAVQALEAHGLEGVACERRRHKLFAPRLLHQQQADAAVARLAAGAA